MPGNRLNFCLLVAALAAAAAYSFWYAFRSWAKNRAIENTPISRVRSAAQGYVELSGHGILPPDSHNNAPLSGMPCAWWRYTVQERRRTGRSRDWSTINSGTSTAPFLLDDGTGRCLIDPRGAEVFPGATDVWYGDEEWPGGRIPSRKGIFGWQVNVLGKGDYRYTEHRLELNEHVCALGAFRSLGGASVEDPEAAIADLLHQWKQDQAALLARFDTNHDGTLSLAEWDRARAAARKQVLDARAREVRPPSMNVLSDPGDGRAFLLAAADGATLARRLRRRASASLAAFLGSTAALTWMLTHV
jgi:hypothetical protein